MTTFTRQARIGVLAALAALMLGACLTASRATAQEPDTKTLVAKSEPEQTQTFFLKNATWANDLNEVTTDLRNVVSHAKIYGVASQNAITVSAKAEDMQLVEKQIAELDRPKKVYRVTLTINESDNGRRTGTQHFALTVTGDNKSFLKQGNRVPIVTGSFDKDTSNSNTQIQYLDVGINIEATISGVGLRTRIEQSSIAEEKSNVGIQDPIVRQTTLESQSTFVPGKPVSVGSIDIPGTTRHQDIEAVAEVLQ
jgi:type II secretory pathway component GspD/PulD (secretin)